MQLVKSDSLHWNYSASCFCAVGDKSSVLRDSRTDGVHEVGLRFPDDAEFHPIYPRGTQYSLCTNYRIK